MPSASWTSLRRRPSAVQYSVRAAATAGAWETPYGEHGWIDVLARVVEVLDLDDIPPAIEANVASVAAVAIYLIRDHLPTAGRPAEVLRYEAAAECTAHLVVAADATLVADHAGPIRNSRGFPVDPDDVMRTDRRSLRRPRDRHQRGLRPETLSHLFRQRGGDRLTRDRIDERNGAVSMNADWDAAR